MTAARRRKPVGTEIRRGRAKPGPPAPPRGRLDPIITMDVGGTIQSVSDDVESLFGWTPVELCGQNVNTLIPEPKRSALDRFLDRYRNPGRGKSLERARRFDAVRKDGSIVAVEISVSRADLPGHLGPFFVGLIRDVSSEVDVAADSPEARSRLQKYISEQTRALATAHLRLQLADRLTSLGSLAAGLGHDLNNVLLPIRARLNAIEHAGVPEAAITHLREVRYSLGYLQHLSDGLHFLSIAPSGERASEEDATPTPLSAWWEQVGGLLRTALPAHVRMTSSLPPGLPSVAIAPHWLTQAALNIIINAGEAIPKDRKGVVSITAKHGSRPRFVRLSIKDNGRGMTPEVQRKALDPFFSTKPRTLGTGLGLPLAQKALARVGGEIEIRSNPGKGTTITMVLPVKGSRRTNTTPTSSDRRLVSVSLRGEHTTLLVSQLLVAAGFRIVETTVRALNTAELWITEPTPGALSKATKWLRGHAGRRIILIGTPRVRERRAWETLGAVVLPGADNLTSIREAIHGIAKAFRPAPMPGRSP